MKRFTWILAIVILLSGCSSGNENITFTATVLEVHETSMLVETADDVGFDKASVGYDRTLTLDFTPSPGQKVEIEIKPEIRESYPVQVTAVRIKLLADAYETVTGN